MDMNDQFMEMINSNTTNIAFCKPMNVNYFQKIKFNFRLLCMMNSEEIQGDRSSGNIVGNYNCDICELTFQNKARFNEHKRNVHLEREINCHICRKNVKKLRLTYHLKTAHRSKTYECIICGKSLASLSGLQTHEESHRNSSNQNKCDMCDKTLVSVVNLKRHIKQIHEKSEKLFPAAKIKIPAKKSKCTLCSKEVVYMDSHLKTHSINEKVKCEACEKIFKNYSGLSVHEKRVHGSKHKLKCNVCDKTYFTVNVLKLHVLRAHDKKKTITCEVCNMKFKTSRELSLHISRIHKKMKEKKIPERCKTCNVSVTDMKAHLKRKHPGKDDLVNCTECGKSMSKLSLDTHILSHQTVICPHCNKELKKGRDYLKTHILNVHEKLKAHTCNICQKSYQSTGNLKDHISAVHNKIKFSCDQCTESFSFQSNLGRHKRSVHLNQTYKCKQCGKILNNHCNLKRHVKTVHELKKEFHCTICNSDFTAKSSLKNHIEGLKLNISSKIFTHVINVEKIF